MNKLREINEKMSLLKDKIGSVKTLRFLRSFDVRMTSDLTLSQLTRFEHELDELLQQKTYAFKVYIDVAGLQGSGKTMFLRTLEQYVGETFPGLDIRTSERQTNRI